MQNNDHISIETSWSDLWLANLLTFTNRAMKNVNSL